MCLLLFMKRELNRKGQVTIFIIIAVVVVVITGIAFYVINSNQKSKLSQEFFESAEIKPKLYEIENKVSDCVAQSTRDSIEVIGVQGGYYNRPASSDDYFDLEWTFIPYYYKEGEFKIPGLDNVEKELSAYVKDNVDICMKGFSVDNFEVSYKLKKVDSQILEEEVLFKIDFSIDAETEGKAVTIDLEDFEVSYESSLYDILEVTDYVVKTNKETGDMLCIECLVDKANEKGVYIDMVGFADNSELVVISEDKNEAYAFEFLIDYGE